MHSPTPAEWDEGWNKWVREYDSFLANPTIAAAMRSSVERGDPLAVLRGVHARERESLSYLPSLLAATNEAVAVDRESLAAGQVGEGLALAGDDAADVEHKRQSRLRSWQRLPPERKVID